VTSTRSGYYPIPGDLVLQGVIPKYQPETDDLSPLGAYPVLVIFGETLVMRSGHPADLHVISLPILEGPTAPQHVPYIEIDDDLIKISTDDDDVYPTSKPGNHLYALLTPIHANTSDTIKYLHLKYKTLPNRPIISSSEAFSKFTISPAKLPWYQWRVYYTLFPELLAPLNYPPFGIKSDEHWRGKISSKELRDVAYVMGKGSSLKDFWSQSSELVSWHPDVIEFLGAHAGENIEPPIPTFVQEGALMTVVPDITDFSLLIFPPKTPGSKVYDDGKGVLQKIACVFAWLSNVIVWDISTEWSRYREAAKYLFRSAPQDCNSDYDPAFPRSEYSIVARSIVWPVYGPPPEDADA
jgi:hypothetical protein